MKTEISSHERFICIRTYVRTVDGPYASNFSMHVRSPASSRWNENEFESDASWSRSCPILCFSALGPGCGCVAMAAGRHAQSFTRPRNLVRTTEKYKIEKKNENTQKHALSRSARVQLGSASRSARVQLGSGAQTPHSPSKRNNWLVMDRRAP